MATPTRRNANCIHWEAPNGEAYSLSPLSDDGLLEIEMHDDLISVHSRNCSLVTVEEEITLAEYECSLSLHRCHIEWSKVHRTKATEVERSAYFQR